MKKKELTTDNILASFEEAKSVADKYAEQIANNFAKKLDDIIFGCLSPFEKWITNKLPNCIVRWIIGVTTTYNMGNQTLEIRKRGKVIKIISWM